MKSRYSVVDDDVGITKDVWCEFEALMPVLVLWSLWSSS